MKNSKGMSVISLVVTVVVIFIITSITVYTGIGLVSDARKKSATDKLDVICNAIRKDDSIINGQDIENMELNYDELRKFELEKYYDKDFPIYLTKETVSNEDKTESIYTLKMYKKNNSGDAYADTSFSIVKKLEKNIVEVVFDELKGVNRPLLYDDMYALTLDGEAVVGDVYETNWYNYNSTAPAFAKMKYDTNGDGRVSDESETYVWIPRYAYNIQEYYNGYYDSDKINTEVPASAVKIVFLRGTTNYMVNNEVLSSGYNVHPAFSVNGRELPGIWVSLNTSELIENISNAAIEAKDWIPLNDNVDSHLMTNSEYAAALYLMFALDSFEQIDFITENEFVAAGIKGASNALNTLDFVDLYDVDVTTGTGVSYKVGDAMLETNWDRLTAEYPTTSKPYIVRLFKSGYFDFTAVSSTAKHHYRAVIVNK